MKNLSLDFIYFFSQYNTVLNFDNELDCLTFLNNISADFNFSIDDNIKNTLKVKYHSYLNFINELSNKFNKSEIISHLYSPNILDFISSIESENEFILKCKCFLNNIEFQNQKINIDDLMDVSFFNQLFFNNLNDKKITIINYLKNKEVIKDITNIEKLYSALRNDKSAYIGFDPSYKSLHLGNYVMINILNILNGYEIKTYPMVGGATGMIGDPSGKSNERNLLDKKDVLANKNALIKQLKNLCNTNKVLDNYDYFKDFKFLDFLRDVGKYINVNYLLEKEIIKTRLETGISFTEFTYTLIQGYDFFKLYSTFNVSIQVGGSDQWGNITTGCELIRKLTNEPNDACGFIINLLTNSEGKKFGKSEKGAIYLDKTITSVYQMYQFLINQSDDDCFKLLLFLTTINPISFQFIQLFANYEWFKKNRIGQNLLAKMIISQIHSINDYKESYLVSKKLFNQEYKNIPLNQLNEIFDNNEAIKIELNEPLNIVDFLDKLNVFSSRREIRELIENNSILINGAKNNNLSIIINNNFFIFDKFMFIKKGKKHFYVIIKI